MDHRKGKNGNKEANQSRNCDVALDEGGISADEVKWVDVRYILEVELNAPNAFHVEMR